ncbi:hypothetical protein RYD26_12560 [Pasteurellaceae bacterium LIM206]|nr:hypothetical protein [Pasteurellaceae bacterium LIM206]
MGHVQIGLETDLKPSEKYQYEYSKIIPNKPLFIIFDQNHKEDRNYVLIVKNGIELARLMEENGSLEYFLSDKNGTFLISINHYSIEYTGNINFSDLVIG